MLLHSSTWDFKLGNRTSIERDCRQRQSCLTCLVVPDVQWSKPKDGRANLMPTGRQSQASAFSPRQMLLDDGR